MTSRVVVVARLGDLGDVRRRVVSEEIPAAVEEPQCHVAKMELDEATLLGGGVLEGLDLPVLYHRVPECCASRNDSDLDPTMPVGGILASLEGLDHEHHEDGEVVGRLVQIADGARIVILVAKDETSRAVQRQRGFHHLGEDVDGHLLGGVPLDASGQDALTTAGHPTIVAESQVVHALARHFLGIDGDVQQVGSLRLGHVDPSRGDRLLRRCARRRRSCCRRRGCCRGGGCRSAGRVGTGRVGPGRGAGGGRARIEPVRHAVGHVVGAILLTAGIGRGRWRRRGTCRGARRRAWRDGGARIKAVTKIYRGLCVGRLGAASADEAGSDCCEQQYEDDRQRSNDPLLRIHRVPPSVGVKGAICELKLGFLSKIQPTY